MPIQISCVVLSYNGGDSLIRTLESCKLQTYPYKDLVIADDASTDNGYTVSVIEKWLADNSSFFTSVLFIKNGINFGIVKNLRNASLHAKGEILFGLGQGDLAYSSDTFESIAKEIETQRQTDPVDPYFWLGEYLGYKIEPNGKIRIVQLYKDLPHQHQLLLKNPYKALKRNLVRWEIGGTGVVYHKKFYDDDAYPLINAPKNWEDGPAFIWALAGKRKIGILDMKIRWYEVGTGISWGKSKDIYKVKKVFNILFSKNKKQGEYTDTFLYDYIQWLKSVSILDPQSSQIINKYILRLSPPNERMPQKFTYILTKVQSYLLSIWYRITNVLIYKIIYNSSSTLPDHQQSFIHTLNIHS